MYFIMSSIWDIRVPHNMYGFVIGGYYSAISTSLGRVTGGSINPARVIGPAIISGNFIHLWIYILGPIIGCTFGGVWYKYGHLDGNKKVGEMHNYDLEVVQPKDLEIEL
jgi:glycerol uptake facilitator-like aquaporin